jgi:hypothetical protein
MSDRALTLTGWWLFVGCAALFIVASARAGDMLTLAGSVMFLAANIAFMIPVLRRPREGVEGSDRVSEETER